MLLASAASAGRQLVATFPSFTRAVNTASEEINSPEVYGSIGLAPRVENKMWNKLQKPFPHCLSNRGKKPTVEKVTE